MGIFGIPEDVYETSAKKFLEKRNEEKEEKKQRFKTAASKYSGKTAGEVIVDAIRSRLGMTEEEFDQAGEKLMENSPAVKNTSSAKSVISSVQSVLPDKNFTTPQYGASAKPIVYSDWSPAAQHFGMDQSTAYAEHMANTAHQREVADLRAAGLNPVLGISGSGSGSVSGSAAMSGSSSAEKNFNLNGLFDFLGATAGLIASVKTKNPATGYMITKAGDKLGDLFE